MISFLQMFLLTRRTHFRGYMIPAKINTSRKRNASILQNSITRTIDSMDSHNL